MKNYDDVKVFVKSFHNWDKLEKGVYYEVIQQIQYKQDKYFVIRIKDDELLTIHINAFEPK